MTELAGISDVSILRLLALLLPGFISIRVYSLIHPSDQKPLKDVILDAVAYSVLNAALLWWFVQDFLAGSNYLLSSWSVIIVFVVAPAIWPFLLNRLLSILANWDVVLYRHRSGWDDFFSRRHPCWLRVHLSDGTLIAGYFGKKSYATLYPQSGHLYIEELWEIDESTGEIRGTEPISSGIILKPSDYRFVEIAKLEEKRHGVRWWWKKER